MELLVRTFTKYSGTDRIMRSKTTERGDVIVAQQNGFAWGRCETQNPAYIILKVAITDLEAQTLLVRESGDPLTDPYLQLRAMKLDLDTLAALGYPIPDEASSRNARYPNGRDVDEYLATQPAKRPLAIAKADFTAALVTKARI